MIWAKYLWMAGSAIAGCLGILHLFYTFFSNKFHPRNPELLEEMQNNSPLLSEDLSLWRAWIGFNGSHSIGLIFISLINLYIAIRFFPQVQKSHFYFLLNIATMGFYVFLAAKYWFSRPLIGVSVILACYIIAYVWALISS